MSQSNDTDFDPDSALDGSSAKEKKNERERRRRLQVSHGFNELFRILKLSDSAKMEKSTVLTTAIDRIKELSIIQQRLLEENKNLRAHCSKQGIRA